MRNATIAVAAFLLLAPAADAQAPPAPQSSPAALTISLGSGLDSGKRVYEVAGAPVRVGGTINAAAAGDSVTVELFHKGRRLVRRHAKVAGDGTFSAAVTPRKAGAYTVRAQHRRTDAVDAGKSERVAFIALAGSAHAGSKGVAVRLLQQQLARLHYVTSRGGHYDAATGRAVLAFRKVNRMKRTQSANRQVFAKLFAGQGGFRLRYPRAGKHVEADLSRQVVVLARGGQPERIYHMSSGKPSTPTVRGTFRFYRKTPGTNAKGMVDSNYFIRGYAIHGYHEVPTFAASHGCIRVPIPNALSIYRWISLGDRIFVYG